MGECHAMVDLRIYHLLASLSGFFYFWKVTPIISGKDYNIRRYLPWQIEVMEFKKTSVEN